MIRVEIGRLLLARSTASATNIIIDLLPVFALRARFLDIRRSHNMTTQLVNSPQPRRVRVFDYNPLQRHSRQYELEYGSGSWMQVLERMTALALQNQRHDHAVQSMSFEGEASMFLV